MGYHRLFLTFICIITSSYLFSQQNDQVLSQVGEKVYLHTDRDIYKTGDDIWFKAYVIDALTNKPSPNTNNLHAELISPRAIIQSRTLRIEKGLGNGDFTIGDSLPAGRYYIRAYTNYMRNFDEDLFFNKEIIIINPESQNQFNDSVKYVENRLYLNFFPEGGSLIENVPVMVGFKATDASGKGINVTGRIYSSDGKYVTGFENTHLGMGFFILKPSAGLTYYAVASGTNGIDYRAALPKIFPSGITMHAFVTEDDKLLVKVLTNDATLPSLAGKEINLAISSRNLLTNVLAFSISSSVHNYILPIERFPEGILRLTLSLPGGLPVAERLVFVPRNLNTGISLSTDRPSYRPREEVSVSLSVKGDSIQPAFFSLSAYNSRMKTDSSDHSRTIASWFLLESDVRGPVEEPSSYFDISNSSRFSNLDLLLLTQGWRDFSWKYDSVNFFRHEIGFSVTGRVGKNRMDQPYPGAKINLGIFDQDKKLFMTAISDSSGQFKVEGLDIIGRAKVLASCANQKNKLAGWVLLDSVPYAPPDVNIELKETYKELSGKYNDLAEESRRIQMTGKKFKLSDTLNIGEVFVTERRTETAIERKLQSARSNYGKPDKELIVTKQMERYPDVLRMLNGNVPGVEIDEVMKIVKIRGESPLILIDGVPSDRPLAEISPFEVDRVDVLYWSSPFGSRGANGIINVISRVGDYNYDALNVTHSKYISLNGFDVPRVFYSPSYKTTSSAGMAPDNRETLYWKPDIKTDGENAVTLKFSNGDTPSTVDVRVEGITSSGIPLSGTVHYEVK